ncbi:MAG TPA: tetratricopeptide repeat protein [Methyloceanibacter sp.]|nr:tetratricopeptide repeat protein [Methyloceanibacter sp.]
MAMPSPRTVLCCLAVLVAGLAATSAASAQDKTLLRAREGAAALMRGQNERAVTIYDEILRDGDIADFIEASIYSDRGVAKWRLKQTKDAVADFNKSIQLSVENPTVYNNRGNALMDLGHPEEAIKDFDRAIALSPTYGAAYNNRGNAHAMLGQYVQAFQDFRKAVELTPQSAVPYNGRGKAHVELKRYHAAVRDFTRAVGLDPKFTAAYQNRAAAYLAIEKFREAADDATFVLESQGEQPSPELLLLRGRALAGDKKFPLAIEDFKRVSELKPALVEVYVERGLALAEMRRFDDAINDFSHAIELDPKNVKAYAMRASARLQAGPSSVPEPPQETAEAERAGTTEVPKTREAPDAAAAAATTEPETDNVIDTTETAKVGEAAATGEAGQVAPTTETAATATSPEAAANAPLPPAPPQPPSYLQVALGDANQALQLAANDALALRVRGDIYQALQRQDEAVTDYRTALTQNPFQIESREALVRLGQEVPPQQTGQPLAEEVAGWIVTEPSPGRYVASNPKFPQVHAELEMFGAGKPRILEWKLLKDALSGIGLLKYYAGDFNEGQDSSLEYVAIVDTRANKVVSIEPHSWGQATAQWNWQAVSVVVTDPDGNANEVQLRKARTRPAAGPPVARNDFWGFQQPAPVARGERAARRAARRGGGGGGGGGGGSMFNWLFR